MSLKNRSIRLLILTVSATAMLLPGASLAQAGTLKAPAGNAFYTASAKQIKDGKPGSVIWSREVKKTANGRVALPSASKTMLVLYRSVDPKGKPIAVSGTIDLPKGKAPKGGFKVISWAHGTTGAADVCAPSRNAASNAAGGTITHHHAVGRTHQPWYARERPALFGEVLAAVKRTLDPRGIMNPGVLG